MPRAVESTNSQPGVYSAKAQQDAFGIENYELPKSLVTKIAKSALPDNAKLQKEVVLSLVKGSTVFINYLAATAHDIAASKQHKSISASDVLKALELLEFGDMVNMLQGELQVYRDSQKRGKQGGGSSGRGKAKEIVETGISGSTSSPPKGKGKGKMVLLPPSADVNGQFAEYMADHPPADDEDAGMEDRRILVDEDDEMLDAEEEDEVPDDDDELAEDDEVDDEVVDTVAEEEDELRRDAKGLDDTGGHLDADD